MKINPIQYAFAYDIPGKLCYVGFPLAALSAAFFIIDPGIAVLTNLKAMALLLAVVVLTIPMGVLVGALFICFFLSPFYLAVERMNGGPFKGGELVYVISGKAKGRTTKVYSGWQGLSARIELGEKEKANFKDVYSSLSLIKIKETEPEDGQVFSEGAPSEKLSS